MKMGRTNFGKFMSACVAAVLTTIAAPGWAQFPYGDDLDPSIGPSLAEQAQAEKESRSSSSSSSSAETTTEEPTEAEKSGGGGSSDNTGEIIAIAAGSALVLGVIGYFIYRGHRNRATTSEEDSTMLPVLERRLSENLSIKMDHAIISQSAVEFQNESRELVAADLAAVSMQLSYDF